MHADHKVFLFENDQAVLSSLMFTLSLQGFGVVDGVAEESNPSAAATLLIDQAYAGDGLAHLAHLRASGCLAPAILLATIPSRRLQTSAVAAGALVIEKPLLGDELTRLLRTIMEAPEAA